MEDNYFMDEDDQQKKQFSFYDKPISNILLTDEQVFVLYLLMFINSLIFKRKYLGASLTAAVELNLQNLTMITVM